MSGKAKLSKSQRKRLKRTEKRKASGSPESEEVGHSDSNCDSNTPNSSGSTRKKSVVRKLNSDYDCYYTDSERYVQSVLNPNTPSTMSYNQNTQYGYQTTQPCPDPNVFSPMAQPHTSAPPPPPWAIQIMEDMKILKTGLQKIDNIEQSVKNVEVSVLSIKNKVTSLEKKVNEIEQTASFINKEFESQKTQIKIATSDINKLKDQCNNMDKTLNEYKQQAETATDKIHELESRSMRENLIFYGIQETGQPNENCEMLVTELIQTKLKIDTKDFVIDRAHRLGGSRARKPRPIVVKFHKYADREKVRTASMDTALKAELKASNQGVGIQLPQQYREARKALHEHAQQARNNGHQTRILGNRLLVDNKPTKKFVNGNIIDL